MFFFILSVEETRGPVLRSEVRGTGKGSLFWSAVQGFVGFGLDAG